MYCPRSRWLAGVAAFALLVAGCGTPPVTPAPTARPGPVASPAAGPPVVSYERARVRDRPDLVRYDDAENPFTALLPGEWFLSPQKENEPTTGAMAVTVLSSLDPDVDRAAMQIVYVPVPRGARVSLPVEIAASEKTLASSGATEITADAQLAVSVNGLVGEERTYNYTLGADRIRQRSVFLASDAWFYTLSLVGPTAAVEQADHAFADLLNSFAERPPAGA